MTPEQEIDLALDVILRASGSALKHYTLPGNLERMREAMRKVLAHTFLNEAIRRREEVEGKTHDD